MKKQVVVFLVLVIALCGIALAAAPNQIIVNSEDWKDVYSTLLYGQLTNVNARFIVSERHANIILASISRSEHIWVISSRKVPFVVGYQSMFRGIGNTVEEFSYDNANLELAKLLDVKNFIIVDKAYGYNAISVAPYAVVSNSYVLFADRANIGDVENFLSSREVGKVILYGHVDREVRTRLERFNPEIINKEGDRFANNIEILKKYQELKHAKQAILTNGEFIEQEIMAGSEPVIFIGSNNVPEQTATYIQSSGIEIGVLIGNELVGTATNIRRQVGISVFVKFAQGARSPQGAVSQVEALDMFYLPTYTLNLKVQAIRYNSATHSIEITFQNTEDQAIYFKGTYSINLPDGSSIRIGDEEGVFLDGNEVKTIVYPIEALPEGKITANLYIIFGESAGSMERVYEAVMDVEAVTVLDDCDIKLLGLTYDTSRRAFLLTVQNAGTVDCYVDAEIIDVIILDEKQSYGLEKVAFLKAGEKRDLRIKGDLIEADLADNPQVKVRAYYGQRENALTKVIEEVFELKVQRIDYLQYSLVAVIAVLIILIILARRRRKKRDGED